jgi:hypothetical protein
MSHLFLSHDHRDVELAQVFATTLSRITLKQLYVWFSSDASADGGIHPGAVWLDKIRSQLAASSAVVALVSPRSVDRPWLHFELGFGAANNACEVIPICVGIGIDEVPMPLAMYQCFQLSDYESFRRFACKVLARYDIEFDEQIMRPVLENAIADFTAVVAREWRSMPSDNALTLGSVQDAIVEHIDRRFRALVERQNCTGSFDVQENVATAYTVPIQIDFPGLNATQHIEIAESTRLAKVLDNIWFMLKGQVPPFSYMEKWVLRDTKKDICLIVREVQHMIRACDIFTPTSHWEAVPLETPYVATSNDRKSTY